MIILKSESKPDEGEKKEKKEKKNDDNKNMVQIHDEQRSIQMTILHRYIYIYTHKNTAQIWFIADSEDRVHNIIRL